MEHLCHVDCGGRHSFVASALGSGIAIVGDDSCDGRASGPLAGCYHEEKLHHIVIYWLARGLDDVDRFSFHVVLDLQGALSVGEGFHFNITQLSAEELSNSCAEFRVPGAGEKNWLRCSLVYDCFLVDRSLERVWIGLHFSIVYLRYDYYC